MRFFFVLTALIVSCAAQAQKTTDPRPFAKLINEQDLKSHLYTFAGKDFEGRETATQGQRKAAGYIEDFFKSIGLEPGNSGSYQMYYPVFRDSIADAGIEINNAAFQLKEDFDVNASSNYSATLFGGEVVFAGYGLSDSTHDDYKGLDVMGKIVMVLDGLPADVLQEQIRARRFNRYGKQDAAQKNGAVALLVVQPNFPRRNSYNRGNMYLDGYKKTIRPNTFYVSEKIAKAIMGEDYKGKSNLHAKTYPADIMLRFNKITEHLQSSDVLGFLEGTDLKDELVVISAHYDHLGKRDSLIYYGADDDGSGTVSILQIAQAFANAKAAGKGPRRSILFLANSGEEKGLWGSAYYTDHPAYPLDKTTVDLNIDMIGRIDDTRKRGDSTNYVYVVGDDKLSSDLRPISEAQNKKYLKLELDYKFNDPKDPERIYYRSDHFNFAEKGVPIIFYYDGMLDRDYHKPTDTPDKIDYSLLAKRAKLVFYTAWEMANRNNMLKRDIPLN
ncbi:MAG: M28 family peptidase [Bacteroidetes bacterium]|nr:M28 family peptidase [Bacteroidota bacterium]